MEAALARAKSEIATLQLLDLAKRAVFAKAAQDRHEMMLLEVFCSPKLPLSAVGIIIESIVPQWDNRRLSGFADRLKSFANILDTEAHQRRYDPIMGVTTNIAQELRARASAIIKVAKKKSDASHPQGF